MPAPTPYILLLEEDTALADKMRVDLFKVGYHSHYSSSLRQSWQQIDRQVPQAVIVDCELSREQAMVLPVQLRDRGYVMPVLLLLAQDRIADRVACLECGADDYLVKPYQSSDFLRLLGFYLQSAPPTYQKLQFADLILDLDSHQAIRGHRSIALTSKEFELLRYLMTYPSEPLSREQILANVWGADYAGESNVIEVYVRYLRIKLHEEGEKRLIHTVRGTGYVLREG
jgi:two-component system, OmpR family, response regulator NblR